MYDFIIYFLLRWGISGLVQGVPMPTLGGNSPINISIKKELWEKCSSCEGNLFPSDYYQTKHLFQEKMRERVRTKGICPFCLKDGLKSKQEPRIFIEVNKYTTKEDIKAIFEKLDSILRDTYKDREKRIIKTLPLREFNVRLYCYLRIKQGSKLREIERDLEELVPASVSRRWSMEDIKKKAKRLENAIMKL